MPTVLLLSLNIHHTEHNNTVLGLADLSVMVKEAARGNMKGVRLGPKNQKPCPWPV